jgi:hypothetical protein
MSSTPLVINRIMYVIVLFQSSVLKKLGQPVMTNIYYNTVKMLLERVSSVMIDHDSLLILVGYVEGAVKGTDQTISEECGKLMSYLTSLCQNYQILFELLIKPVGHYLDA